MEDTVINGKTTQEAKFGATGIAVQLVDPNSVSASAANLTAGTTTLITPAINTSGEKQTRRIQLTLTSS